VPPSSLQPGNSPGYSAALDPSTTVDGSPTELLSSPSGGDMGWAPTVDLIPIPPSYWGKRFRMRAKIKTENAGGGWLWFRIDQSSGGIVMDNMHNPVDRTLKGTVDWTEEALVLDVPQDSIDFAVGSGLDGAGKVWVGPITIEEVGTDVPTTPFYYEGFHK
jgi:hypothetical protein